MKYLFTFSLVFFLCFNLNSQVPQGVGYQGVATDANGIELVNQAISIRASVLSGSATGTIEWEETHATSTDTFGLFTITIGQGTNTTNGAQTSFADISWGTNTYFLKIEMDVTGGSNYSFMGTNQMMSVPYALYAESAGIDSTMILNIINSSIGGGGCNYSFPEGISGQTIAWDLSNGNDYTVPTGKNLYITNVYTHDGSSFRINGIRVLDEIYSVSNFGSGQNDVGMLKLPLCVKSGEVVSASTNPTYLETFYGILTDAIVEPISFWFDDPGTGFDIYTVPLGKKLVVTNLWMSSSSNHDFTIDGVAIAALNFNRPNSLGNKSLEIPLIINSGSVFSAANHFASFNGYLVDENYFADCGGGSSTSTSSLDSTTIANMIASAGGGCDYRFPEGLGGEPITQFITRLVGGGSSTSNFTIPSGKTLYITNWFSTQDDLEIIFSGTGRPIARNLSIGGNERGLMNPIVVRNGDQIVTSGAGGTGYVNGVLIDSKTDVQTISLEVTTNNSYTVPNNKIFVILNAITYQSGSGSLTINNNPIFQSDGYTNVLKSPIIAKGGELIEAGYTIINGYLVDENYFADCGGGGSTSSTSTTNNQINNYNNILNQSVTSGTFNYLFSNYPTSITYTVPNGKIMKITERQEFNSGTTNPVLINGQAWGSSAVSIPQMLSEGTQLEIQFNDPMDWMNLQFDLTDNNQSILLNYLFSNYPTSITYTVPNGKIMKITEKQEFNSGTTNPVLINGQAWGSSAGSIPQMLSEGTQLEIQFNDPMDWMNLQYILFDN